MKRAINIARAAIFAGLIGLAICEITARSLGVVDFPLYDADSTVGYIPKANQNGSFRNTNNWIFNEYHMGSRPFAPSAKTDVLLVGDSIVLGGNPLKQNERLGPQLENISDFAVWPISAGSWALRNELAYLRKNAALITQVDSIVFVLNTGDLDKASAWKCELTHPRENPAVATWYLFKKYIFSFRECDAEVAPELAVKNGDLLAELKEFLKSAGSKTHFVIYPDIAEFADNRLWKEKSAPLRDFLRSAGIETLTDVTEDKNWSLTMYRDGIHPNVAGNKELAEVIKTVVQSASK